MHASMRRRAAMLLTALSLSTSVVAASSAAGLQQTLPELRLDELPAAIRTGIQDAVDEARRHPDDPSAVGRVGMLLHAYDQHRSAESCYRAAHALDPRAVSWAYLLGIEQAKLGHYAEAAESLRRAVTSNPDYLPARIQLADMLLTAGDLDASLAEYAALVREVPDLAIAHYGLGRVATMRRDVKAAVAHYQRAVEISPQFGTAHYALALAYRDSGLDALAHDHAEAFRRWGARRPLPPDPVLDSVNSLNNTARHLLVRGSALASEGRVQEAIAQHLKAIAADPTLAQAHVNLISLYGRLGRTEEAEFHYRAALALKGSAAEAHYNYGVLKASARGEGDAIEAFRHALDINPFHAPSHNNLATLLAARGQLEEAVTHYQQAVANDPLHRSARFNLAVALIRLGRLREAGEQTERLPRSEDADTPRLWFALARAWWGAQESVRARECAEQALRRATVTGQTELAAGIERDLARMATPR